MITLVRGMVAPKKITTTNNFTIKLAGENSLIIYFLANNNDHVARQVAAITKLVETTLSDCLIDVVPSYASVLVIYNVFLLTADECQTKLEALIQQSINFNEEHINATESGKLITLPVYYSDESGPDLSRLAQAANLSIQQFISIHQQTLYRVYAIGFSPGFAYMGEIDPRLAAPRLNTPRTKVPKGAVAIAGRQTAVYPAESPGGWNLIGLCPVDFFSLHSQPMMPVKVGDSVQFEAISREHYLKLGGKL